MCQLNGKLRAKFASVNYPLYTLSNMYFTWANVIKIFALPLMPNVTGKLECLSLEAFPGQG